MEKEIREIAGTPPAGEKKNPSAGKWIVGTIRSDLQFIPPGRHGDSPMLYDPLSETYYKLSARTCDIMRLMDKPYEASEFLRRCGSAGIPLENEELLEIVSFMDQSGLYAMEEAIKELQDRGAQVLMTIIQPQPMYMLTKMKVIPEVVPEENTFKTFEECTAYLQTLDFK